MFDSVEDVQQQFKNARYIAGRRIATVVYLAERMGRPVLIEGPAGVGKTELAKTLAEITSRPLIRLQCYEGLDEGKALYEWKYAKQLLYTQLLKERIGELIADAPSLPDAVSKIAGQDDAFFSYRFLSPRPLLSAIQSDSPVVLLIDEIDKAEPEFEAFLLEVLSDFQVSIPELGTVKARHVPLVVLTSNNARELSDGLKRRCLHLFIDFPAPAEELEIIRLKVPEIPERLARAVDRLTEKFGSEAVKRGALRERASSPGAVVRGRLHVDASRGEARLGGRQLKLERRPLLMLQVLANRAGEVVPRSELLERVWGSSYTGFEHSMEQAVHQVRRELREETGLEIERQQFAALFATQDRTIGMRSFVESGPGKAEFEGR